MLDGVQYNSWCRHMYVLVLSVSVDGVDCKCWEY